MSGNPAERLVDHALGVEWSGLPQHVQQAARTFLHDSLAVGVAGRNAAHANSILAVAQAWGAGGQCPVLGRPGVRLPAASAAFVNAFQIHGQEFDCVHEGAVLHPMATVLASVLAAMAGGPAVSGEEMLASVVGGVDVAVALGIGAPGPLRFFRPATAGIFGCVAAIARLRRLPREQALDAFGHALAFVSGTMQAHVEGMPALPIQVGNSARNALAAIDLANACVPGVRRPIDGPFGYFALFESEKRLEPALAALGRRYFITELSWKPFPTGRAAHGGIVALRDLVIEHGLSSEAVATIEYRAPSLINRLVGRPAHDGMASGYARLCFAYLGAVTLLRGTVTLEDFGEDRLSDPATLALAQRIRVVADDNPDPAAFVPALMVVELPEGQKLQQRVSAQFGSPERPLSREEHLEKARQCLEFGGLKHTADSLETGMDTMDSASDAQSALEAAGVFG